MEDGKFDSLARALGSGSPRRSVLKTAAGGALGAAIAAFGLNSAGAAGRARGDGVACSKDADCDSGSCLAKDHTGRRVCGCGAPFILCDGQCLKPYLGSCQSDSDCCSLDCYNGTCYSCFIAGTRIAMADGTTRPIETVQEGDYVLGANGQANRVIAIERPLLGSRALYSMNGGRPFVTAEHPFATEAGWKSIDPAATADENPALAVDRLGVGDRLLTLASVRVLATAGAGPDDAEIALAPVALTRLDRGSAPPATPLFNLLLDGDHAYFADDFLVHNKD